VVILTPQKEVIATGRARMSAERMLTHEKGMAVKTRWNGRPESISQPQTLEKRTWDDAVSANMHILKNLRIKRINS